MPQTKTLLPSSWHEVLTRVQETLTRYAGAAEARARELEEPGRAKSTSPPPSPAKGKGGSAVEGVLRDAAELEAALAEAQAGLDDWLARAAETGQRLAAADASL